MTDAHVQQASNHYLMHYPAHDPREGDPHYKAFNAYHRKFAATAVCCMAKYGTSPCSPPPYELHHSHIEFSLQNGVDPVALSQDFPHVHPDATQEDIDNWVESDENFIWLCSVHHRSAAGIHHAAYADYEASKFVKGLIS